jgi:hypothetical protein
MIATRQWHFGHSPTILNHLSRSLVHHLALRVDLVSSSCSIAVVSGRHLYYGDRLRFPIITIRLVPHKPDHLLLLMPNELTFQEFSHLPW